MSELVSPYVNTELYSSVSLLPYQMDNDIYINLKENLKNSIEKKCNKYGYITKIFKILEYDNGVIHPENFLASALYNIKYSARICIPIENTKIICKIDIINKVIIKASNGPILCVIKVTDINKSNFSQNNQGNIINNKGSVLDTKYFIKIIIRARKYNSGDDRILILGILDDIATQDEINEFYYENLFEETDRKKSNIFDETTYDNSDIESDIENTTKSSNYINL